MDDAVLDLYLPILGNRIMTRQFIKDLTGEAFSKVRHTARINATKNTRRIEVGLMSNRKVLRTSSGGGTQKIVVPN